MITDSDSIRNASLDSTKARARTSAGFGRASSRHLRMDLHEAADESPGPGPRRTEC